jgi:hypothetical protein
MLLDLLSLAARLRTQSLPYGSDCSLRCTEPGTGSLALLYGIVGDLAVFAESLEVAVVHVKVPMLVLDTREREILRQTRLLREVGAGISLQCLLVVSVPLADLRLDNCADTPNLSGGKVVLDADFFGGTS